MIPFSYGIVTGIIKSVGGVSVPPVAVVQWDDMGEAKYTMSDLKSALDNDGNWVFISANDSLQEWLTFSRYMRLL